MTKIPGLNEELPKGFNPVIFPLTFESRDENDVLWSKFTITEPDAEHKVMIHFYRPTEEMMLRLQIVMTDLMDNYGVTSFNIIQKKLKEEKTNAKTID